MIVFQKFRVPAMKPSSRRETIVYNL